MSKKFKVTLVGTRRVGKTALAHWAVNTGPRTTYDATSNPVPRSVSQMLAEQLVP